MTTMDKTEVDILILGAGWTSQFFVKLFDQEKVTYALTTTTGKINKNCEGKYDGSKIIPFVFQPDPYPRPDDYDENFVEEQYSRLPRAKMVVVSFKLEGKGQSEKLMRMYSHSHAHLLANFVQLGSTGIFKEPRLHSRDDNTYEHTPRAIAEDEFIEKGGHVLALAGLWGDERVPWNWLVKVAPTKEKLLEKKALHLIHGWDVARACLCMYRNFYPGDRSIVTDCRVYDWWSLFAWWAFSMGQPLVSHEVEQMHEEWQIELMDNDATYADSPRSITELGRVLDSHAFWHSHHTRPEILLCRTTRDERLKDANGDLLAVDLRVSKDEIKSGDWEGVQ